MSLNSFFCFLFVALFLFTVSAQQDVCRKKRDLEEPRAVQGSLLGGDYKIFASGHSPIIDMMEQAGIQANPLRPVFWQDTVPAEKKKSSHCTSSS